MNLRKIALVGKREYLTRIKSKAFILLTFLIPLGMAAFIGISFAIMMWETESDHKIAVVDQTGVLYSRLQAEGGSMYRDMSGVSGDSLQKLVMRNDLQGYLVLTEEVIEGSRNPELVYGGRGGLSLIRSVKNDLQDVIRQERLKRAEVSENIREIYAGQPSLETRIITKEGIVTTDNTGFRSATGFIMGLVIFFIIVGYGGWLTRSVIEEKTNRIVEVIASSVKPIELLIGKIMGVAGLAVTQIGIWIVAGMGLSAVAAPIMILVSGFQIPEMPDQAQPEPPFNPTAFDLSAIEPSIIIYFIIFFILGFLIYSSLFAAIGSAVDNETDTQQFMMPVMIPILIAYLILFKMVEAPDSTFSVISSIIPFFAPILMITRITITDVPFWQIGTSIILMIATFYGTMWLSAKIYSVGILSYGKSATFRELWKWIREG